jgi:hypothetical protein
LREECGWFARGGGVTLLSMDGGRRDAGGIAMDDETRAPRTAQHGPEAGLVNGADHAYGAAHPNGAGRPSDAAVVLEAVLRAPVGEGHLMVLPEEFGHAAIVAALHEAIGALHDRDRARERRDRLPANVGKPWTQAHDTDLLAAFDAGVPIEEIAARLQRTRVGIRTRLERHGRLVPQPPDHAEA